MKKICAMLISASLLNSSMAAADQDAADTAGGGGYDNHAARKDDAIASLEKQLTETTLALAALQNYFAAARDRQAGRLQQVAMENELQSLHRLSDGISFPVYFHTNDSALAPELGRHIRDLAGLIRAYPQIMVRLDAYADERGLPSYNLQLSKARALSVHKELSRAGLPVGRILQYAHGEARAGDGCGGPDAYVPDRRVDVQLTLETGI